MKPDHVKSVFAMLTVLALSGYDRIGDVRDAVPGDSNAASTQPAAQAQATTAGPPRIVAPAAPPTDSAITDRVQAGLKSDPALAGSDVSVNTDHGVVHLAGLVKS